MGELPNDEPTGDYQPDDGTAEADYFNESDINFENRVGYRNPPKEHRWQKGNPSPNPSGRPRKDETKKHRLTKIATRMITINEGGRKRDVSIIEAIILRVKMKAIANDPKAIMLHRRLISESEPNGDPPVQRGYLVTRGRMSEEEWDKEYGHLANKPNGGSDPVESG